MKSARIPPKALPKLAKRAITISTSGVASNNGVVVFPIIALIVTASINSIIHFIFFLSDILKDGFGSTIIISSFRKWQILPKIRVKTTNIFNTILLYK